MLNLKLNYINLFGRLYIFLFINNVYVYVFEFDRSVEYFDFFFILVKFNFWNKEIDIMKYKYNLIIIYK